MLRSATIGRLSDTWRQQIGAAASESKGSKPILNSEEREVWLRGSEDLSFDSGANLTSWTVRKFGVSGDSHNLIEPE